MDRGDGVEIDDIVKHIKSEEVVTKLIEEGEIFQIKPGKVKILE